MTEKLLRPILSPKFGERDVIAHGEETHEADEDEGDERGEPGVGTRDHQEPIEQTTGDAGHGIDFFLEDERFLVEQDVADDTACGARDAPHDDGHPEGMAAVDGLLKTGYGEEGKAEGVEHEPGVVETFQRTGEDDDEDLGQGCADKIEGRRHPKGGDAQHHVADGAAADGHSHTTNEASEPVEMLGCGVADAGDGKGECS